MIGDILDLRSLVVVREDHRVALCRESPDLRRPIPRRTCATQSPAALVIARHAAGHQLLPSPNASFRLIVENLWVTQYHANVPEHQPQAGAAAGNSQDERFRHEVLAVVLQVRGTSLDVLLWRRGEPPFAEQW